MATSTLPNPHPSGPTKQEDNLDQELEALADTRKLSRIAFWVLGVGFGGFLLWAGLVPLDEGVPTMGTVVLDKKRKPVQHPNGGTVFEVLVREGELVVKDQPLVRLGTLSARAALETASSDLAGLRENLEAQKSSIIGYSQVREGRLRQQALLQDEYEGIKGLAAEGYVSENQSRDLERRLSELSSSLIELGIAEERARRTVSELRYRIGAAEERLLVAKRDLEKMMITASTEGQVIGLEVTPGAVISAGQRIMDIVPQEDALVLETQVEPNLIDRVAPGDLVDIRFSSFSHSPQLVLPGLVESISQDVLTDEKTRMPYYLARILVTPEGLEVLGKRRMQPGMPVEVIIKTGSRTLLEYLAHPLTRRISQSLKEE